MATVVAGGGDHGSLRVGHAPDQPGSTPPATKATLLVLLGLASIAILFLAKPKVAALQIDSFLWLAGAQAILCLVGAALVWNRRSSRAVFWIIFGVGVLLRLGLVGETPKLSDDVYRYIWDGRVQAAGINPYRYIPADPHLAFLRDDAIYPHINRRDYAPTIYPPGTQMFFFAVTRVTATIAGFKAALLCLEALTFWLIARLLVSFNLPRERVIIYAWNPLVLWEFCSGHIDVLMTTLVLLALLARHQRRNTLTGVVLGCAALVKFLPLALFPALYRRGDWKMPLALGVTICAAYLPYLGVGAGVIGFLPAYSGEEGMSDGRFFLLLLVRYVTGGLEIPAAAYLVFCFAVLSLLAGLAFLRWNKAEGGYLFSAGIIGTTVLVLLSPQFPWYWIWLTPLLVFLPFRLLLPFFYLSCAALLQYGKWFDDWHWFGFGINPFLARDILQLMPVALMLVVLGCSGKSFHARPIARARSLLPDQPTARLASRRGDR